MRAKIEGDPALKAMFDKAESFSSFCEELGAQVPEDNRQLPEIMHTMAVKSSPEYRFLATGKYANIASDMMINGIRTTKNSELFLGGFASWKGLEQPRLASGAFSKLMVMPELSGIFSENEFLIECRRINGVLQTLDWDDSAPYQSLEKLQVVAPDFFKYIVESSEQHRSRQLAKDPKTLTDDIVGNVSHYWKNIGISVGVFGGGKGQVIGSKLRKRWDHDFVSPESRLTQD
jgi:hypothetical protein